MLSFVPSVVRGSDVDYLVLRQVAPDPGIVSRFPCQSLTNAMASGGSSGDAICHTLLVAQTGKDGGYQSVGINGLSESDVQARLVEGTLRLMVSCCWCGS
jgi:hypothetical protein